MRSDINARRSTAPVFVQDIEQNPSANYGDIKIISLTYKSVCGTTVRGVSARGRSRRSCQPHHRLGAPSPAGSRTCAMAVGQDAGAARPAEEIPHDHLYKVTGLSSTNLQKLAQGTYGTRLITQSRGHQVDRWYVLRVCRCGEGDSRATTRRASLHTDLNFVAAIADLSFSHNIFLSKSFFSHLSKKKYILICR